MRNLVLSIIIALSGAMSVSAFEAEAQLQSQMSSSNSDVRASAMEKLVNGLNPFTQPQRITQALPTFMAGLSDSNPKVREYAAAGLQIIAASTLQVQRPANPNLPNLKASPKLKQALLSAMSDNDPFVSQAAIQAYSMTYKITPSVEQTIIAAFNIYQPTEGQPDARIAMFGALVNDGDPSPAAINFIVQKTDDPKFGIAALQSLAALKKPPSDALPKLLKEAGQPNISENRKSALKLAVKAYGPDAEVQLRQTLASPH